MFSKTHTKNIYPIIQCVEGKYIKLCIINHRVIKPSVQLKGWVLYFYLYTKKKHAKKILHAVVTFIFQCYQWERIPGKKETLRKDIQRQVKLESIFFNPSIYNRGYKQVGLCEIEVSLVYKVSSRTARAT